MMATNSHNISHNHANSINNALANLNAERKPIQLDNKPNEFIQNFDKLPPINNNNNNNNNNLNDTLDDTINRSELVSALSSDSKNPDTKKIFKWRFWWEKNDSNIRIPIFESPSKLFENTPSRIGSLDLINHKPGGGNVKILDTLPEWHKVARIDHIAKDYKPGGGNVKILDEKVVWDVAPKVGSFDLISHKPAGGAVKIIEQPYKPSAKSRIDTGLILEEVEMPYDYEVQTARTDNNNNRSYRPATQILKLKDAIKSLNSHSNSLNTTRLSFTDHNPTDKLLS